MRVIVHSIGLIQRQRRNSSFAWPRVAIFEAARELWRLRYALDIEKVCLQLQHLYRVLYTQIEGKNVHTAWRETFSPIPSCLSGQLQEVPCCKMFFAYLRGAFTCFRGVTSKCCGPGERDLAQATSGSARTERTSTHEPSVSS